MEQPVEIINVENLNTVPENPYVHAYKKCLRMILEIARDHYERSYPYLEKVIEKCSK